MAQGIDSGGVTCHTMFPVCHYKRPPAPPPPPACGGEHHPNEDLGVKHAGAGMGGTLRGRSSTCNPSNQIGGRLSPTLPTSSADLLGFWVFPLVCISGAAEKKSRYNSPRCASFILDNLRIHVFFMFLAHIDTMKCFYCPQKGASVVPWGSLSPADQTFFDRHPGTGTRSTNRHTYLAVMHPLPLPSPCAGGMPRGRSSTCEQRGNCRATHSHRVKIIFLGCWRWPHGGFPPQKVNKCIHPEVLTGILTQPLSPHPQCPTGSTSLST